MSLVRVFIAIELSEPVCDAIQKQTARLRQTLGNELIRWVPTQNMHLTLKFLGDTSTSYLDFLKQLLAREADSHPQFNLQLDGTRCFSNPAPAPLTMDRDPRPDRPGFSAAKY